MLHIVNIAGLVQTFIKLVLGKEKSYLSRRKI